MGSVTNPEARLRAVEDRLEAGADVLVPLYKTEERNAVVVRVPRIHRRDLFRRTVTQSSRIFRPEETGNAIR